MFLVEERSYRASQDSDDLPTGHECSAAPPSKRKADVKSSRTQANSSRARNTSPLRKKPKLLSAEKTQIARRLAVWATLGMFPLSLLLMSLEIMICSVKKSMHDLVHLLRGKEMQIFLSEVQVVCTSQRVEVDLRIKRGVDSSLPIPLEVRLAEARKARESSTRAKGSSETSAADPKVDKSNPAGDAGVSDMLKTHFLSSPSACAELVDQIHKVDDLGVDFAAETIRNSSYVAPSSAQLSELEKKNAELFKATMDAYKLGYLDCTNVDGDIEMLCPDLLPMQIEQVNVVNMEGAEEQVAEEAAGGAAESMADQADVEEVVD
ncbi:unnamed protein product [Prunus armeniaca]